MVLLILAVIWAAVLVPPMLRARAESSPVDSIGAFRRQLSVLQRTAPAPATGAHRIAPYFPPAGVQPPAPVARTAERALRISRSRARQRRRQIFLGLAAAVPVSAAGALVSGGIAWIMPVLVSALLITYVGLLVRARNLAAEREMKVRFLPGAPSARMGTSLAPELALRRSAN